MAALPTVKRQIAVSEMFPPPKCFNPPIEHRVELLRNEIHNLEKLITRNNLPVGVPYSGFDEMAEHRMEEEESAESLQELLKCKNATEELLGFKFIRHEMENVFGDNLPPGRWRAVTMEVLFDDCLQTIISFTENYENPTVPVISLTWDVKDNFQRAELESLKTFNRRDLPGLICKLKDYTAHYIERHDALEQFFGEYNGYLTKRNSEHGVCVTWPGVFNIVWSIKFTECTEKMINILDIKVNEKKREFIMMSRTIIEKLIEEEPDKDRLELLLMLGSNAVKCSR